MTHPVSILLPGLDGTGQLFERFIAAAPSNWQLLIQPLPGDKPRGYQDLADYLLPLLPTEPFALVAESFSGPLAILLANRCPRVSALALCASFVRSPLPASLARVAGLFSRRPPPRWALNLLMTGGDGELANAVQHALGATHAAVVAARISAALNVDVSDELGRLAQPLLCLRAARDRLLPARCAEDIRLRNASAEFVSIDGPHLLLQARPNQSWQVIAAFLERARE